MRVTGKARNEGRSSTVYRPGVMWFFQLVSVLDPAVFRATLAAVDDAFEIDVLASQISALSVNVRRKAPGGKYRVCACCRDVDPLCRGCADLRCGSDGGALTT